MCTGKTTLLNRIWGLKGQTGLFYHTDVPTLYQISDKIHVVDFPGKLFTVCIDEAAVTNLL